MTKRDVLSIALKIIGVVCIVVALTSLPGALFSTATMTEFENYNRALLYYLIGKELALAICAYFLLAFSTRIARWMIPDDTAIQGTDNVWSGQEILMLIARIIGVYFLVRGLSSLGWAITQLMQARSMEISYFPNDKAELVRAIIQVIAAIYLLSGARAMIAFIYDKWPGDEHDDEEETTVG